MAGLAAFAASPAELESGGLGPAKLAALTAAFDRDGVVIMHDVLPHSILDHIAVRPRAII